MLRLCTLSLLIPLLLMGCNKPADPVEPVAATAPVVATPASEPAPLPPPVATSHSAAISAQAVLMPTQGNTAGGELTLTPEGTGLRLSGRLTGLAPGATHAFHVHEKGDCSDPAAESAGPHFNPTAQPHGNRDAGPHHAGDMPNLVADASGNAEVDQMLDGVELGTQGPNDVMGRALIVHAQADDYTTQPSGNAGARIACGVIGRTTDAAAMPATDAAGSTPPVEGDTAPTGPAATPQTAPPSDDNGAA